MKTLVISDLHNRIHWVEKCIAEENPDLTVFLGDYFDSYDDTLEITRQTAEWLKESLNTPNRVHLMGNHDISYRFPMNDYLWCPGFSAEKSLLIDAIIRPGDDWEKIKSFHWVNGWLLSHAGIPLHFLHPVKGFDLDDLRQLEEDAFIKCSAGMDSPLFACGFSRGGSNRYGGITWQDFDVDFLPIESVNQIVGHTPHPSADVVLMTEDDVYTDEDVIRCTWDAYLKHYEKHPKKSLNIDIDTHRKHYAIIENGEVQIRENKFATDQDFSE